MSCFELVILPHTLCIVRNHPSNSKVFVPRCWRKKIVIFSLYICQNKQQFQEPFHVIDFYVIIIISHRREDALIALFKWTYNISSPFTVRFDVVVALNDHRKFIWCWLTNCYSSGIKTLKLQNDMVHMPWV